jgi:catechol-2,3-dioxygenase
VLAATHERLREEGVEVSPVDHGISRALYFDDPDGDGVEVYLDTRETGGREWDGQSEPFDPDREPTAREPTPAGRRVGCRSAELTTADAGRAPSRPRARAPL